MSDNGRKVFQGIKKKKTTNRAWLAWLVPGAALLMLLILNLLWGDHWLESDMAAEMVFSRLLVEEGEFLATGRWYYSTEFRVLYTQLFMQPLFYLFSDWHTVRAITNLLTYLLLLSSYFYMMKPLKIKCRTVILLSALLLLPISETMITHVQMGNTYMFHMIIIFIVFGMFLRLAEKAFDTKIQYLLLLACYVLFSVVCGLSGIRYMLALQAPLMLAGIWYLMKTGEFAVFRRELKKEQVRAVFSGMRLRYLIFSLLGVVSYLAGYVMNVVLVAGKYDFQTYEETNFISIYQGVFLERLQDTLGNLLMLFGYIPDKGFLSLRGLITMIAFILPTLLVFILVRIGKHQRAEEEKRDCLHSAHRHFLRYFFISAFWLNTFVFLFATGTIVSRYYITVFMFALPLLAVYFEGERLPLDKVMVAVILCGCLSLTTVKIVYSYVTTDKNEDKRRVAVFLEEEEYEFGYATFGNANIMTELTNGRVEVANIHNLENLSYFLWSSPRKYYEDGYHTDKTFLLLTGEEAADYAKQPIVAQGNVVYEDEYYRVIHFDTMEDFQEFRE